MVSQGMNTVLGVPEVFPDVQAGKLVNRLTIISQFFLTIFCLDFILKS